MNGVYGNEFILDPLCTENNMFFVLLIVTLRKPNIVVTLRMTILSVSSGSSITKEYLKMYHPHMVLCHDMLMHHK